MTTIRLPGSTRSASCAPFGRLTAMITLILMAALSITHPALAAEVTAIRVADHTRYQRVVVDTSAAVSFAILEDKTPLTLQIYEATAKPQSLAWSGLGMLKGAWVTQASANSVHISFDLAGTARPRVSSYTPDSYGGHRIVIDLWPIKVTEGKVTDGKAPETKPEPKVTHEVDRINELTVGALDHQPSADMTSGQIAGQNSTVSSGEFWPDLGSTNEDEAEDLMEVPGLKVVQQWPDLLEEAAKTIRENESASALPPEHGATPAHEVPENVAGLELKPALDPQIPSPDIDPISAARRSLAQGQPGDACKVLQVNYPKGTWNIEAMVLQGACLSALGKLVDANTLYTEVLSFEPGHVDARLGLAKAQADAGDLTAARDNYTRALETMPSGESKDTVQRQLQEVEDQIKHAIH